MLERLKKEPKRTQHLPAEVKHLNNVILFVSNCSMGTGWVKPVLPCEDLKKTKTKNKPKFLFLRSAGEFQTGWMTKGWSWCLAQLSKTELPKITPSLVLILNLTQSCYCYWSTFTVVPLSFSNLKLSAVAAYSSESTSCWRSVWVIYC